MLESWPFNVLATVGSVQRRLGWARIRRDFLHGVTVGAVAGVVGVVSARTLGVGSSPSVALACLVAGGLVGLIVGARSWPDAGEAARVVDRHFDLHDRLVTALERRDAGDTLSVLQRGEAAARIYGLPVMESARGQIRREDGALLLACLGLLATTLLVGSLPFVSGGSSGTSRSPAPVRRAATTGLPSLLRRVERGLTPAQRQEPAIHYLDRSLRDLQRQLFHTSLSREALRAISVTQGELQRYASSLHRLDSHAVARLNSALSAAMSGASTRLPSAGDASQASAAVRRLAAALRRANAAQRTRLARALSQAARDAQSRQLQSALQRAAAAAARGDTGSASAGLRRAAATLQRSADVPLERSRLAAAASGLDTLKNQISGMTPPSPMPRLSGARTGAKGQSGPPSSSRRSSPQAMGSTSHRASSARGAADSGPQSRGARARGTAANSETNADAAPGMRRRRGAGATPSASGSTGSGGGGTTGVGGHRRFVTVYVPGREGAGPRTVWTVPGSTVLPGGRIVPYRLVIVPYTRAAHAALGGATLPPSLESYVRRYFSALTR